MKKIMKNVLTLCAIGFAVTAWGAFQYSNETVKANEAGYFEILKDSVLNISYDSAGTKFGQVSSFGYFLLDSGGNILSSQELSVQPNITVSTPELKTGERVGFWLKSDKTDQMIYSVSSLNSGGRNYFSENISKTGNILFSFGDQKWDSGVLTFSVAYTNSSHTGQPLPGILATLLLGGGTLAFVRMKRAKTKS